ncbi:MAG: inorganic pyrophosphatase, inorganic pyrophosphatase [Candidatus Nomurabacteria bacterium]|nr:inorganic pyrophosphatase, inorganic pyrophosphatase [Candidatus Nomurabacteria bacterium]
MENLEQIEPLKFEISVATPEDARGIREVQYKTWLETYTNENAGITTEDVEKRFEDAFTDEKIKKREESIRNQPENENFYVVKNSGKVIGFCMVIRKEDRNQLQAIYILPEFQGKGLGKNLWNKAKEFLDKEKDTYVEVVDYNQGAINFYTSLGFKKTDRKWREEEEIKVNGKVLPEIEMVRKAEGQESKSLEMAREYLSKKISIVMDRPMGTKHPKHGFIYEVNYGFIEGTKAPDGEELDTYFLGVKESLNKAEGICIAIAHRRNNDDDKLIIVPEGVTMTDEEIIAAIKFQEQYFDTEIVR